MAAEPIEPLEAGNEVFHGVYGEAQDNLRHQVPTLVVLPTELALHHACRRTALAYSSPLFTRAKVAAHLAVTLFTLTDAEMKRERADARLSPLIGHISAALDAPRPPDVPRDEVDELLERCLAFARAVRNGGVNESDRARFASEAGPQILRITELATREQLTRLHAAVEEILTHLSAQERDLLQVVVVGDHQARTRSFGMQYFKRRFGEGVPDRRVTYGENVNDEEEAISLVAKRRLDQNIARAFFGDEHRLQRDVLGDAAMHCLDQMGFPR